MDEGTGEAVCGYIVKDKSSDALSGARTTV
jgi:hypothetical protein